MMKFDIMVRPLEVLVVVVVDHLQVERQVCSVSEATALLVLLVEMFVVLSLVDAVLQVLSHLLHLVPHSLDLERAVLHGVVMSVYYLLSTSISRLSLYCCLLSLH